MPGSPGTVPAPDLPPGQRLALVVATTTYTDPELRRLRSPSQDAEDLTQVLADPDIGGFTVTGANITITCLAFGPRSMIAAAQSTVEIKQAQQLMNPAARAAAPQTPALLKRIEQFKYPTYHDAAIRVWT
jgi:hypothetical protein